MAKFFIALILAFGFLIPIRSYAALPNAPSDIFILPDQNFAYRHILETNDALFLTAYWIENRAETDDTPAGPAVPGSSWQDYTNLAAIAEIQNSSGTVIREKSAPRLGVGVLGFYFTAAEFAANFTWSSQVTISIEANPALFANASVVNTGTTGRLAAGSNKWRSETTHAGTVDQLEEDLPKMMKALEVKNDGNYTDATKVDANGVAVLVDAFPYIVQLAPDAFIIGSTLISPDKTVTANQLQTDLDASSSAPRDAITGLSNSYGFNRTIFALGFLLILAAPAVSLMRTYTKSDALAYSIIGPMLTWGASMNLIPIALPMSLAVIFFGIIGIWIWRQIPTG